MKRYILRVVCTRKKLITYWSDGSETSQAL